MKSNRSARDRYFAVVLALCMALGAAPGATSLEAFQGAPAASPDQLDKLLAPVALYPDALLMQVLAASVNSQEVLDGGNWLLQNKTLEGTQLDDAAKAVGFGAAMIALFHFPQVVDMMCSEIDWTKQLGAAFTADQSAVLDSVQRLRLQAQQAGNLKTTTQQTVVTQAAGTQQVIVIQPANPQIIYVPQYNPVQVYVAPPPSQTASVVIAFGVGIAVGAMFSSNNYYYPHWGYGGGVYYRGGPWVVHHYHYRPVYGPNYHRATLYYRPPNYAYAYNRPYPGNAHYNSNNYYNNYRGNTNIQNSGNKNVNVTGNNVTINTGNKVNNSGDVARNSTVNSGNTQTNQSWKGQSTYNGGNKTTGNASTYQSRNPSGTAGGSNAYGKGTAQTVKPDRGYSSGSTPSAATRPAASQPAQTRPGTNQPAQTRPATNQPAQTRPAASQTAQTRPPGAFEGAGNTGKSERTAAAAGRGQHARNAGAAMKLQRSICSLWQWRTGLVVPTVGLLLASAPLNAQAVNGQKTFASPTAAVTALVAAAHTGDPANLVPIIGPNAGAIISSGDLGTAQEVLADFVTAYGEKHSIKVEAQGLESLEVGMGDWPFPFPIVRDGHEWYFDISRGNEEILTRRVGRNELGTIAVCEGYVQGQKEYAAKAHDGNPAGVYAQRFQSNSNEHDGLYWADANDKRSSPMGPLVAQAAEEQDSSQSAEKPIPFHGYFYKILTAQGPDAPGGAKSYLVDGKMTQGFALIAYPSDYRTTGVMTFIVNEDGVVFQKDLGDGTAETAAQTTTYNPDDSWQAQN